MKKLSKLVSFVILLGVTWASYPLIIGAGLNGNCPTSGSSFDTDGAKSPNTKFLIGGTTKSKQLISGINGCYT